MSVLIAGTFAVCLGCETALSRGPVIAAVANSGSVPISSEQKRAAQKQQDQGGGFWHGGVRWLQVVIAGADRFGQGVCQ